jgi:uncharacterized repeat protein (TIGR03803 family)
MHNNTGKGHRAASALGWAALCAALIAAAASSASAAPQETVLHTFRFKDGFFPAAGVIADRSGNLYGTTERGGAFDKGVAFKLSPPVPPQTNWTETVLHSFCSKPECADGSTPVAGLLADSEGNLYGTTADGGASGLGVVFTLRPGGPLTVLHSFDGSDGSQPEASLIADTSGNLYGTTAFSGMAQRGGTVFKLTKGAVPFVVLHAFCSRSRCDDGAHPVGGLHLDAQRNLYGATAEGGASQRGVVFELGPDGTYRVLYAFCRTPDCPDGATPFAGVIAGGSGNLYGTTSRGGAFSGGVVFKLSPPVPPALTWTETVLYSFCSRANCGDGSSPVAGLIADRFGSLFGMTEAGGGASGEGVAFKLSPPPPGVTNWPFEVLHSFCRTPGCPDGAEPIAGLIADSDGNLYGTTSVGGGRDEGVVFELTDTGFFPPVTPFSSFTPRLQIDLDANPIDDAFLLLSEVVLGVGSDGINPPAEPVVLTIGRFTTAIPQGSFMRGGPGRFTFAGVIDGVDLQVGIEQQTPQNFSFAAAAQGANLTGIKNPVPVALTIGLDNGTASVNAQIGP